MLQIPASVQSEHDCDRPVHQEGDGATDHVSRYFCSFEKFLFHLYHPPGAKFFSRATRSMRSISCLILVATPAASFCLLSVLI